MSSVSPPPTDPLAALQSTQRSPLELALDALDRIRRRWWLALLVTVAVPSYVFWRASQQPIYFQSQVALLLVARPPRVVDKVAEVVAEESMLDTERFAAGQMRLIRSDYLSNIVENNLHMPKGALSGRLVATLDPRSHVITFEIDDLDPKQAEHFVDAFASAYVSTTIEQRTGVAHDATRFLDGEAGTLRTKLEVDEKALYDFNKTNTLLAANFDDSHRIASQSLEKYHGQAANARSANIKLRAQMESIAFAKSKGDPALLRALSLPAAGDQWNGPQGRWLVLQEQLRQLESKYGPQHPKVIEMREAVAAVVDSLDKQVQTAVATVDLKFHENESELAQLRVLIGDETAKAMSLRQKELDYLRLKRTVDEDRDAYTMVARRGRETALVSLLKESFVKRLEGPTPPGQVSRRVVAQSTGALAAGLVMGLLLALLIDLLDDSLKTPAEAERELKQPLLGLMMQIPLPVLREGQTDGRDPEIARAEHIVKNPRSLVAEQCHSFTTQIFSLFMDKPPRALMVVSAAVEDGKTLVALHLASTVAARGKRVLIVDADLRRGRLHRMFQLGRGGGLYELVTQKITVEEACRRTWIPNVDVLTAGDVPLKLSPLRVFEHPELERVVQTLKDRYDLVVFDTPPVPLVSDALLLADMVDGAVAVARAKKTSRALTRRLAEQLLGARVNLIGWLLNDLSAADLKSKYYYRYGYGRGYAYKYSDEEAA